MWICDCRVEIHVCAAPSATTVLRHLWPECGCWVTQAASCWASPTSCVQPEGASPWPSSKPPLRRPVGTSREVGHRPSRPVIGVQEVIGVTVCGAFRRDRQQTARGNRAAADRLAQGTGHCPEQLGIGGGDHAELVGPCAFQIGLSVVLADFHLDRLTGQRLAGIISQHEVDALPPIAVVGEAHRGEPRLRGRGRRRGATQGEKKNCSIHSGWPRQLKPVVRSPNPPGYSPRIWLASVVIHPDGILRFGWHWRLACARRKHRRDASATRLPTLRGN